MRKRGSGRELRGICACTTAALLLCACGPAAEQEDFVIVEQEEAGSSYEFAVAEIGNVVKTVKITCKARQLREEEVSFQASDRLVDKVYVAAGDTVKKGQLLVELSSGDLERRIQDLEYQIARNELLLGYVETNEEYAISRLWVNYLYGGMGESARDSAIESTRQTYRYQRENYEDALAADRAELALLREELRTSRIYAPMDGVVYHLKTDLEGSTSKQGEVVMTVMDTSETLFETEVEDARNYFTEGETYSMKIGYNAAAGDYELLPWHMEEWDDKQLFVVFDSTAEALPDVGTSGTMQVVQGSRENVVKVPLAAVYSAEDRRYVYVLENDMREVRWVETGLYGDDSVEILSGLTEGERVILK